MLHNEIINRTPRRIEPVHRTNHVLISEKLICILFLLLCLPIILAHAIPLVLKSVSVFRKSRFHLNERQEVLLLEFNDEFIGYRLPYLLSVISGEISLVGAKRYSSLSEKDPSLPCNPAWAAPGLFSILDAWCWVGLNTNNSERQYSHYLRNGTFYKKCGILLKILVNYAIYSDKNQCQCSIFRIFDIKINNLNQRQCIDSIVEFSKLSHYFPAVVNFVNANNLNIAFSEKEYRSFLQKSDLVLSDGSGIRCACRLKKIRLKANLNGTDLFTPLCKKLEELGLSVYFLGAKPETTKNLLSNVSRQHPKLSITGSHHGHFDNNEAPQIIKDINESRADILFVGMGSPRQEEWIDKHKSQINCKVVIGVGGLFDFYSGRIKRAPLWMREIGLEWTWRMLVEPGRLWKRYLLGNPMFLLRIMLHEAGETK